MAFFKLLSDYMFFFLILINLGSCQDFGYDGSEGPNHWGDKYAKCIGKHQSPIDIEAHNVISRKFPKLVFERFDEPLDVISLENNGHTVLMKIKEGEVPTLRGGPLKGTYVFSQLHFHWGPNDTLGSENQINHKSFPLELHMVMYNKEYQDMTDALNFTDGLTVLSFLYSATNEDNKMYDQFEDGLQKVQDMFASTEITNFVSLNKFTTNDRKEYFAYTGSLTTPPCSEVVTWIEFMKTIPLSTDQIQAFRLLSTRGGQLTHNYRPVQPLYDRIIYMNAAIDFKSRMFFVFLALIVAAFINNFR